MAGAGSPAERTAGGEETPRRADLRRRPRAILFDLFHTLVDVNGAPGEASSVILGVDPLVWNAKIMYDAAHHALGLEEDPYESVRRMAHEIDPAIPEERIRAAVAARPKRFRHALVHVRPEILEGLRRLRALGLSLGLVSNAGLDEVVAWPESPLAPLIEAALFSCHEKVMKPDPEIYRRAAARLGVVPSDCLFVGDGGSHEHDGARRAGMRTALFLALLAESAPDLAASRPRNTDYVVASMEALAELVEGMEA
jgi:putative hydrolase of the HAD superfamily